MCSCHVQLRSYMSVYSFKILNGTVSEPYAFLIPYKETTAIYKLLWYGFNRSQVSKATSAIITSEQDAKVGSFSQYHASLSSSWIKTQCRLHENRICE